MRIISIILFLFIGINPSKAQFEFISFEIPDQVDLQYSERIGPYYIHNFQAKETIYGVAKFFGSNADEIYRFNPSTRNRPTSIGEKIIVPVRLRNLIVFEQELLDSENYIPAYYTVQKKDNIFRIANRYFQQDVVELMRKNGLRGIRLEVDQRLLIGWFKKSGLRSTTQNELKLDSLLLLQKNGLEEQTGPVDSIQRIMPVMKEMIGIAVWDKNQSVDQELFVMHSEAKPNSIIEINNPMFNKRVYARVIASIPSKIYPNDVSVILSPQVAKELNALDTRLRVEMRYIAE